MYSHPSSIVGVAMSWHEFKSNLATISLLARRLACCSRRSCRCGDPLVLGFSWPVGLSFGGIVSPAGTQWRRCSIARRNAATEAARRDLEGEGLAMTPVH